MKQAEPCSFPWEDVLGFAFGILRLPPQQVWRMTPREIVYALPGHGRSSVIGRDAFDGLMRMFPD